MRYHHFVKNHLSLQLCPFDDYFRSYRSVGDETFMTAFEDTTLLFEDWTHEAHLRMAWNYIHKYGKDDAIPKIRSVKFTCG